MLLKPVQKTSLTRSVYTQLRDHILTGELAAGEALPSERQLSEQLSVNRSAVREALKKLEQAGLVTIQHGGKTRVLDFRSGGGLDLLPALLELGVADATSVHHLRSAILPEAARLAAEHADSRAITRIEMLAGLLHTDDAEQRADLVRELWDAIVDASGNIAFRLAYNALREAAPTGEPPPAEEFADLANALAAGDTRGAALTTLHLVRR